MQPNENAITQRFEMLSDQWEAFCEQKALILRWLLKPDELSLVDSFIDLENTEAAYTEDAWIPLYTSFESEYTHGFSLVKELDGILAEAELLDTESPWNCPQALVSEDNYHYFSRCLHALQQYFNEGFDHMAIVLKPQTIGNIQNYQKWLLELQKLSFALEIKILLLDNALAPIYSQLSDASHPSTFHSVYAQLDMSKAYADLSAAPNNPAPGDLYKENYVAMQNAMSENRSDLLESHAEQALKITQEQSWPHLEIPVHMLRGAFYLNVKNYKQSLECYQSATQSAETAYSTSAIDNQKMKVYALLGQSSVYIQTKEFLSAGVLYAEAAELAKNENDLLTAMDCNRMACFCYTKESKWVQAKEYGSSCLEQAEQLGAETAQKSSFPYVKNDLLKASKKVDPAHEVERYQARIHALLFTDGPDNSSSGNPS